MQSATVDDLLQFKDFSNEPNTSSPPAEINVNSPTHASSLGTSGSSTSTSRIRGDPLSELIYDMSNTSQVISGGNNGVGDNDGVSTNFNDDDTGNINNSSNVSFLTIEYYQQFFNVDTYMVLERIVNSILPKRASTNYLRSNIGKNPDLYGPFWINITLIFLIAISGNIASYLQHVNENFEWRYNFHLVSYAATCIFIYVDIFPAALWALFKYSLKPLEEGHETETADFTPSLLSLVCIYGYSLSIYIPVSILWVIQVSVIQWILVITAALLSGSVLIIVLTPALRNSKISLFLIIGILGAHFLLAAGFMLYFFHDPTSAPIEMTLPPNSVIDLQTAQKTLNLVKNVVGETVKTNTSNIAN